MTDAETQEAEAWLAAMHMSDDEFYAEVRPEFPDTETMKIHVEAYGRHSLIQRLLSRGYTGKHRA